MTWVKLDDGFYDHPKVAALGDEMAVGVAVHIAALCYCSRHLTDGFVPAGQVARLMPMPVRNLQRIVTKLVLVRMWEDAPGGYMLHDYLIYNWSRAQVLAEREASKRRRAGRASGESLPSVGRTSGDVRASVGRTSDAPYPYPYPYPVDGEEESLNPPNPQRDEQDALDAYKAVGGNVRSEKAVAWLYRLVSEHGADRVIRLIGTLAPTSRIDKLLGEVEAALVRGRVETAKAEDEDQAARARTNREVRAARKLAYLRGEITEAEYETGMKS